MAESTVKALERQLEGLQKVCLSLEAGTFPKVLLLFGDNSQSEVREYIDQQLASYGLNLKEVDDLGLLDNIVLCRLPWLKERRLHAYALPDIGSE